MGKHFQIYVQTAVPYMRDGRVCFVPYAFDEPIAIECLLVRGDRRVLDADTDFFPHDSNGNSLHPRVQGQRPFRIGRYPVTSRATNQQDIVNTAMANETFSLPCSTGWHDLQQRHSAANHSALAEP